jgi:hypothetical protein
MHDRLWLSGATGSARLSRVKRRRWCQLAERREYGIPGDPELAIHLGYTEELDWTPQRLNKELRLLEEVVESWGELPDKWRHKHRKEWAWMKDTAFMVYNCRAAFRARRSKKAIKIYKLIQGRLATKDKQPLQKQRAAARKARAASCQQVPEKISLQKPVQVPVPPPGDTTSQYSKTQTANQGHT